MARRKEFRLRAGSPFRRVRVLIMAVVPMLAVVALSGCGSDNAGSADSSDGKTYTIGILEYNQSTLLTQIVDGFKKGLKESAPKDVTIKFDLKNANGDQSLLTSIANNFHQGDDDAFAVVGTPAVIAVAQAEQKRPIFALAMGDPVGAGLAKSLDHPGKNVTGSVDFIDPKLIVKQLKQIQPSMTSIGTVFDPSNQNAIVWVKALEPAAKAAGIKLVQAGLASSGNVAPAARSLAGKKVDAIIIGPAAKAIAGIPAISAVASSSQIPMYLSGGGDVSTPGVLAGIGADYSKLGVEAGKIAAKVVAGEDAAAAPPFYVPKTVDLTFNKKTLNSLGLDVPADVLSEAQTVE